MSLPPLSLSHFLFVYLFHNKVTLLCCAERRLDGKVQPEIRAVGGSRTPLSTAGFHSHHTTFTVHTHMHAHMHARECELHLYHSHMDGLCVSSSIAARQYLDACFVCF